MADWTAYDHAALRDSVSVAAPRGRREVLIGVDGVHCSACIGRIEKLLANRVTDLRISLTSCTLQFRFDPASVALSSLLARIDDAGFAPRVLAQDAGLHADAVERRRMLGRIGVAVICAMQVMMLAWPDYTTAADVEPGIRELLRWAQAVVATPSVLYAGWPFHRGAWQALRGGHVSMDVPVAASIAIAYGASVWRTIAGAGEIYFDTATMFVMLLLIGRFVESRTRALAGTHLRRLAGGRRLTAQRESGKRIETVPLGLLTVGDVVWVAPGESVPVDGSLLDAAAELDEALLTGESRVVVRHEAERLLAGSLNVGQQALRLRATGVGAQTWLAQVTQLLHRAQAERPRFQQLADRYAGAFIMAVLVMAAASALLWWTIDPQRSLAVALSVLVASCPCALSLAVPAATAAASARLAATGVLAARPEVLSRLPQVDTVLFDKTGTLTHPELRLVRVHVTGTMNEHECLRLAAALEQGLLHPIARAFAHIVSDASVTDRRQVTGQGVEGTIDGRRCRMGAPRSAVDVGATHSVVELGDETGPLARFVLGAAIREDAAATVAGLLASGLHVELLSGDGEDAVRAVAQRLGIAHARARQTPDEKLQRLRELQREGRVVLAVGDGINDAPLLAAADVSAAMPQGAALAQARADLLLLGDSIAALAPARRIAAQAQHRIRENVSWAIAYNLGVLPLAMSGWLAPWMAALGMSLSSLLVVVNALRVRGPAQARVPAVQPAQWSEAV